MNERACVDQLVLGGHLAGTATDDRLPEPGSDAPMRLVPDVARSCRDRSNTAWVRVSQDPRGSWRKNRLNLIPWQAQCIWFWTVWVSSLSENGFGRKTEFGILD